MRRSVLAVIVVSAGLIGGVSARLHAADEKAADARKPAAAAPAATADKSAGKKARQVRLTKPWNQLGSLSEEQRGKIAEIHKKAVADKKQIETQERADIMAVLNDEQRAEITAMTEKQTAERKMKKGGTAAEASKTAEKAG